MRKIITQLFVLLVLTVPIVNGQEPDPFIQLQVNQLSRDSVVKNLRDFENLGIKNIYSQALVNTAQWIADKYISYGYTDIFRDTFYYGGQALCNLVITKTGSLYPDKFLIIDGHYDTYMGPGTNDNGSGTAILLEVARMMKDLDTEVSLRFIHFSAEEEGLVGSNHYVNDISGPQNHDIMLVFNIDEVGGVNGMANNVVICERDETPPSSNNEASWAYTDTLVNLTSLYTSLNPEISYAYGSDYVPFQYNGNIITGYYEANDSPWVHSINDSLSKLDTNYVYEIAKGSLATTLYFSGAYDSSTGLPSREKETELNIVWNEDGYLLINNLAEIQDLTLLITELSGRKIREINFNNSQSTINLNTLQSAIYLYSIRDRDGNYLKTGKFRKN